MTIATDPATEEAGWRTDDSAQLYGVPVWGNEFFAVNSDGHACVKTDSPDPIDIHAVVGELVRRGVSLPVLLRFQDILRLRVRALNEAFALAIEEAGYANTYRGVYPIKVNQLQEVVVELLEAGQDYCMGLECGSKSELVAALPHVSGPDMLLICNGIKDRPMLELMLGAQRLGQRVIPVIEKYSEYTQLTRLAKQREQKTLFGVRLKLATPGVGRWAESAGSGSKFGITMAELLSLMSSLRTDGREDELVLLHFHLGSQIGDIQAVKQACKEIAQTYAQLHKRGFPVQYLDVGGGLGIDYDVPLIGEAWDVAYSLQEYANAIVFTIKDVCEERGVPVPVIVSESGRALTAHHSVLIVPVLGVTRRAGEAAAVWPESPDISLQRLRDLSNDILDNSNTTDNFVEAYHDWQELKREITIKFEVGVLDIEQVAAAESLSWQVARKILAGLQSLESENAFEEQVDLEDQLTDQYLGDVSIFQSILDHWSIGQTFPIMPVHRLDEEPLRRGVLVDLTCDSDGKVGRYVSSLADRNFLPLHEFRETEPYYLGVFLMGAYQDILGDAHNLFGRVAEAHVYADEQEPEGYWIEKVIPAVQVKEMLETVQYYSNDLSRRMSDLVRARINAGAIRPSAGMAILEHYTSMFSDTTYCRVPGD